MTMLESPASKHIALVAHDHRKEPLLRWVERHRDQLGHHRLYATGTTGRLIRERLGLEVLCLESGPLGGDQQIGARIAEGEVDCLVFFWDPLEAQPHDPDIKALLRLAAVWNIPVACNEATADFLVSAPQMEAAYQREVPQFSGYRRRLPE